MQTGNWIQLRLLSRARRPGGPPGQAEGARVVVRVGDAELRRSVTGASYLSQSTRTLHLGLGAASRVDAVEVHWLGGASQRFGALEAGAIWELREGEPDPRLASGPPRRADRERVTAFWQTQRAAMQALKRDGDVPRAVALLRGALALDPSHEDSRYYLANGLATLGHADEALGHLDELIRRNPRSHRALKQWGILRALEARSPRDLALAEERLEQARELNPEETGTLLALGEVALLRGDAAAARQRLEWACRTNPRAVGGFFLRAYLAWRDGEADRVGALLARAREARGEDWKPEGTTSEGDVARRLHRDTTPLSHVWLAWDGGDPGSAFGSLEALLPKRTAPAEGAAARGEDRS
jgi:tetratricopeptide (TPR) repeat protein